MNTAQQAGRILEAWHLPDARHFKIELQSALLFCEREIPVSALEYEHQAVLQSAIQLMQQTSVPQRLEAGLFLLRHLKSREHKDRSYLIH